MGDEIRSRVVRNEVAVVPGSSRNKPVRMEKDMLMKYK